MARPSLVAILNSLVVFAALGGCESADDNSVAADAAELPPAVDAAMNASGRGPDASREQEPPIEEQGARVYVLSENPGGQSGGSGDCSIPRGILPNPTSAAAMLDRIFETELVVRPWYGSTAAQREPATRMPMTVELTRSPVSLKHLRTPGEGGCGPDLATEVDVWLRVPERMTTFRVPAILHQSAETLGRVSILLAPEAGEHFPGGERQVRLGDEPDPLRFTLGIDDDRVSGALQQEGGNRWYGCVVSAWPHEGLCRPHEETWPRDAAYLQDKFDAAVAVAQEPHTLRWTEGGTTEVALSLSPLEESLCASRELRYLEAQPVVSHLVRAPYAGHLTTADGRVDVHLTVWIALRISEDDPDYGDTVISGDLISPASALDGTVDFGIPEARLVQVSYRHEPGAQYPRELFVSSQLPHADLPVLDGPVDGAALSGANLNCWNDREMRAVAALRELNWD